MSERSAAQRSKIMAQFSAHQKGVKELQRRRTEANKRRRLEQHIQRHPTDAVARAAQAGGR